MIHATRFYEIDPEQIEAIARETQIGDFPHVLKITTLSGRSYCAKYASEADREKAIKDMVWEIERAKRSSRLTAEDIRWAVAAEIDKLRPYLRRIEKILKETKKEEPTT